MQAKIGLGTAALGRPLYININPNKTTLDLEKFIEQSIKVLDLAYEKGIKYYDTAPGYGLAEELLINWVKKHKDQSIEIASKWGYEYVADFNPHAKIHERKEHSIALLKKQAQQTQKLLPYLTTYQIHSATLESGVLDNHEILDYLHKIKEQSGVKIGLTTTGEKQVEVIKKALDIRREGVELFEVFQSTYNILDTQIFEMSKTLKERNKRLIIKESLANGRLFKNNHYPEYTPLYSFLEQLENKYNTTTDAIALQFCRQSIDSYCVLSGANLEEHLRSNLQSDALELLEEDIIKLKDFAIQPKKYWQERKNLNWN